MFILQGNITKGEYEKGIQVIKSFIKVKIPLIDILIENFKYF